MRIYAAIMGFVLSGACTTVSGTAVIEGKVKSWVGVNRIRVQEIWGKPTHEVTLDRESRLLQFSTQSAENPCTVVLTLNTKGEVTGTRWNGSQLSCSEFVKASPTYKDSLVKEINMAILEALDGINSF